MISLKSPWSFWYHSSKERNWDRDSYIFLYKTQFADELWGVFKLLSEKHFKSGIIFLMRNDIFPDWSSPENKNGGFISIKIDTRSSDINVVDVTKRWIEQLISESITTEKEYTTHGIKKKKKSDHCILKLWFKDKIKNTHLLLSSDLPFVKNHKFTSFSYKK